ncbi:MAG TPA: fusion protein [Alphaproteobacteria bacterium]|jgi:alkylhydroperoxidase family enzyme|nr:fusion protein [Rhodospirillaceae bacterium]HAO57859.1 fusion protein [Alphaproteobacteria bacterium]HBP60910.1 fusion protein [Alphaproteobacteria bacterium]HCA13963.1 fusion protein [Alphaproteobacteria bacterium]HCM09069.1 fusion protein [Alphaproteobacteria bacterium]|tara:strand:- start:14082 stop:14660 length:579 start_codon:yes stop_codon:yes gene_type:complete
MTETNYENRQEFEMEHWPELRETWNKMIQLTMPEREVSRELKQLVFTVASLASGCRHCQSHGAYHLHQIGVSDEKIQALWSFETSDLFDDSERAALRLAMAAGVTPNAVEPENFVEMRQHFSNIQIIEILAVIATGGYLNRWNDTIATVTDQESIDFAQQVLQPVGWDAGKHVGAADEQRKAHPLNLGWSKK